MEVVYRNIGATLACCLQGRPSSPWGNDAFPLLLFPKKKFGLRGKFSQFDFFQRIFRFSSAKISHDIFFFFLVIDHKFWISYFHSFSTFLLLFWENYYFPPPHTFPNFPPDFVKFTCFYILCVFFVSPYFDGDACMNHTMHYWTPLAVWLIGRPLMAHTDPS